MSTQAIPNPKKCPNTYYTRRISYVRKFTSYKSLGFVSDPKLHLGQTTTPNSDIRIPYNIKFRRGEATTTEKNDVKCMNPLEKRDLFSCGFILLALAGKTL